jgi:FkbM family methyltransferase
MTLPRRIERIRARWHKRLRRWRVISDARRSLAKLRGPTAGRGLFIDCGSNVGQGFTWFRQYFPLEHYDYILVEPNPHCVARLRELCGTLEGHIEILDKAAGTGVGQVRFFGLTENPQGLTTEGGSTLAAHNSRLYSSDADQAITVTTFSLAELIRDKQPDYRSIVLKMDIEGAEYDVLDDLLAKGAHRGVDAAYVEFHSQYMLEPDSSRYRRRELELMQRFRAEDVPFRLWK